TTRGRIGASMSNVMTPEQKRLVRDTWKQVAPIADAAADMFYRRLFEIDPTTRELFHATDMVAQRKKLLQMLAFAISGLDNLGALVSKVEDLGRRTPAVALPTRTTIPWAPRCCGPWNRVSVTRGHPRWRRHGPRSTNCCPASCATLPRAPSSCKTCGPLRRGRPLERQGICCVFRKRGCVGSSPSARRPAAAHARRSFRIIAAPFSAIIMVGALVLPD